MSVLDLNALNALPKVERILALAETNAQLEKRRRRACGVSAGKSASGKLMCCRRALAFRRQSGLHLVNPDPPGYSGDPHRYQLPVSETYRFIDELTDKLQLNLKIDTARLARRQEARGKLWEQGVEGVATMRSARLTDSPGAERAPTRRRGFAGLRRERGIGQPGYASGAGGPARGSRCYRLSTGITARCISTCKSTG